ncbi:hypothetical protein MTP99_001462 [Tenebrio molitor]|nr:hypothetical protein MTP99_001462 [Tenebrio molitor]
MDITDVEVKGQVVEVHVWDTCSKERFKHARIICYKSADVFSYILLHLLGERVLKMSQKSGYQRSKTTDPAMPQLFSLVPIANGCRRDLVLPKTRRELWPKKINAADYINAKADYQNF